MPLFLFRPQDALTSGTFARASAAWQFVVPSQMPPTPAVRWGASFANLWEFPGPIDEPVSQTVPVGTTAEIANGEADFWLLRTDQVLRFRVPLVPRDDGDHVTGYATPGTGVREALAWLSQAGNEGRFYPDRDDPESYHRFRLLSHAVERHLPGGSHYTIQMEIRDLDGVPFGEY